MNKVILASKIGMTQIFINDFVIPITVLQAGPCVITQIKTKNNDGYNAIQIGFVNIKSKKVNKPIKGHFDKIQIKYKKFLKEFKLDNINDIKLKQKIKCDIFKIGDKVDITGISKGKGFQGTIKKYNHSRGPMSHGSKYHRHSGSNGASSDPSRVFKGKKMPGQMGFNKVTIQNLKIINIDVKNDLIFVKGSVPGNNKSLLSIKKSVKMNKFKIEVI